MSTKSDIKSKGVTTKMKSTTAKRDYEVPTSSSNTVYLAKSMTIREDQYMDITSLAAYNKLFRRKPDTVSAVVRAALDHYLSITDDSYRYIGR